MYNSILPLTGYITDSYRQHVYRDLHPYCCTFGDCTIADRLYDSRRTWFQHELGHRTCWQCVEGCNRSFSCEKDFVAHVQALHPELTAPNVLTALKHSAKGSANLSDQGKCPLCNESMTLRVLQKHLGRHQKQLALFALPQNLDDTEDGREDDESQASINVKKWQDENISDVRDTAHIGNDIESEVEDPIHPQPASIDFFREVPRPIFPNGSPALDGTIEEEEESTIKCICGYAEDDGGTVLCEKCDTWQHIACYYGSSQNVPDIHECATCLPRPVDKKGAAEKQRQYREMRNIGERKGKPPIVIVQGGSSNSGYYN
jgi:hypothetical protein